MMYKLLLITILLSSISACGGDEGEGEADVDKHPATGSFSESTKPKKIQSSPCSNYNLKFYEGDERDFSENLIRLGASKSDAKVEINGKQITILGFEGQAEEYVTYSIYRGIDYKEEQERSGTKLSTNTETQITVCFRQNVIAVKQLVEKIRSRGELSKAQYFTKQWLWRIEE